MEYMDREWPKRAQLNQTKSGWFHGKSFEYYLIPILIKKERSD
jgi:hypothetical protein